MGSSSSAVLAYGYDLGGEDEGWKFAECGEFGELPPLPWHQPYDEGGPDEDFDDAVMRRLLAEVAGFTEVWSPGAAPGFMDRRHQAAARLDVSIETYGYHNGSSLLVAHALSVGDFGARALPRGFAAVDYAAWDSALAGALSALGLTPLQEQPAWILASAYN
jgi:hypothetical protein